MGLLSFPATPLRTHVFQGVPTRFVLAAGLLPLLAGCGLPPRLVGRMAGGYLETGAEVFEQERDPAFAEAAIPANVKLLEVLLARAPHDRKLNTLAAEYLGMYAYAFLEPRVALLRYEDLDASERARARAGDFYLRARAHGLEALSHRHRFLDSLDGTEEEVRAGVATLGKRDLPALFWTAFSWGNYTNLHLEDPEALADSLIVVEMMKRVVELDEGYYYAGAHLFFGAMLCRLPVSAGGDPEKARHHFERALALTKGRFLMARLFFARYYAVRVQDRALWDEQMRAIQEADLDAWPEERLANTLAKEQAAFYQAHVDEFFFQ